MKKTILYITMILLFASCEKVIHVDLNEANQRIVIDGQLHFQDSSANGLAYVNIHKTSSFYDSDPFETIDNAQVEIIDKQGIIYPLSFAFNGYYYNANVPKAQMGDHYQLRIKAEGKEISSSTSIARPIMIDSLSYSLDGFGPHQGDGYTVSCHFTDPANEVNFYYLKLKIEGLYEYGYFITRDDGLDGKPIEYKFFRNLITDPSKVQVELYSIDEAAFEYYKVLAMMESGGMSTAPGNPPSNIEGDAIGLFTGSFVDVDSIFVP